MSLQTVLDPAGRKEVMDTITYLSKEEGTNIIHITHYYMEEAIMQIGLI